MSSQQNNDDMLDEVQEPSDVGKRSTYSALARRSNRGKTQLLKPCLTTSIERSESKALSMGVSFYGWRFANKDFKLWAKKMSYVHEHTWRKAGIFEAIMASTVKIPKDIDLVLAIAKKWCPETKTFVFPWGEATITLEDVMVLLGFTVLGLPIFASLDISGKKTKAKLEKECLKIKRKKGFSANQVAWIERFMDSGDELEHVAFLVSWLSYFVFPSRYYHHSEHIFPIAVHLSRGTRAALAPAVLAHLYAELSLLRNHIRDFEESSIILKIGLTALFKLVQVWTWERFRELQPKPNQMQKGEPRLARWHKLKQITSNAWEIHNNSKTESFELRPYTQAVECWEFPQFYPEKAMIVHVGPSLDDEYLSFARCIKVSELVGIDCVEHYFPNRVALQFGMLQDVPSHINRSNLSKEAAWNDYDKPIDDLTLYIPSRSAIPRVTQMFCEWRRALFLEFKISSDATQVVETALKLQAPNIKGDDTSLVPSGSKISRRRRVGIKIVKVSTKMRRHYMKQAHDKKRKNMKRVRENDENDSLTYASEPLGKKSRLEADNNDSRTCQKFASIRCDGDEILRPPEIEQRNEKTVNKAAMLPSPFNEINSSDSPLGGNREVVDILVSPPETTQTCDDELDVHGSFAEKMTTYDDCSKEPDRLLQEDGITARKKASSDERLCSSEADKVDDDVDDDSLIQKKLALEELALNADNNDPSPRQNFASGCTTGDETSKAYKNKVIIPSEESNTHIAVREGSQGQDCLFNVDSAFIRKSVQELMVLSLSIEERIIKAQQNVAWLKERRAEKQRNIAEYSLI
ncbi:PREDICTED: uncharacterized protein LOC104758290 [Camelina sativa]|uniref:Uncharacterized protein LOC104758290 n=1 Tax=Camelina sativa TaxID=90675 RepID=A0ABM0X205_CAMSA|nr:PREDICTED: uncharacterized protein LOC104758290 [Camelina sativa]